METRKVEMFVGYTNYQWNTCIVDIPSDTPDESILTVAELKLLTTFDSKQRTADEIAFVGIYDSEIPQTF